MVAENPLLLTLVEEMHQCMEATRADLSELRKEFQEVTAQQDVQQKVFDTLHTELSDYKNDFVGARMKPMIATMLFLHDAICGFHSELEAYVDPPDWLGERVLTKGLIGQNLDYFQEQLDEVLRMCELQPMKTEVGVPADPKMQTLISAEPTDDPSLHNHIQKVVRTGWVQGDKVFRPAEVVVWKVNA